MAIDDRIRLVLPRILSLTVIGAVAGAAYGYATAGGAIPTGIARGTLTGALIASIIVSLDMFFLLAPGTPLARAPFLLSVGLRSLVYLAVFLAGIAAGQWLLPHPDSKGTINISRDDILFCFAVMFVITFLLEVNLLLGDLSGAMVAHKGEIQKFVGDELIATWPLAAGLKPARCLLACFDAIARMAALGPSYQREFGLRAEVRAALHCGPVVVGEMGSFKKEIALSGDTVNTTARLVDACRETGEQVIASATLLEQLVVPSGIAARALGPVRLHGKKSAVELFALQAT